MKKHISIVVALALVTSCAMILLITATTTIAFHSLTDIIETSQQKIYTQRSESVLALLQRRYDRLIQTGMPEAYEDDFQKQAIRELEELFHKDTTHSGIHPILFNQAGTPLAADDQGTPEMTQKLWDHITTIQSSGTYVRNGKEYWIHLSQFKPWGWTLCYTVPAEIKFSDRSSFFMILLPIMVLITAIFIAVTIFLVKKIVTPIGELTHATHRIASGDLSVEIRSGGIGELAVLASNFSSMRDSIRDQMIELTKREERLLQITNNMTDVVYTVDFNLNTTFISPSVEHLLGYSPAEYMALKTEERYPPESLHIISETVREELERESDPSANPQRSRIMELEEYHRDGSLIAISNHAKFIRNEQGVPLGFQGVTRDITAIRRAQEEQKKLQIQLHQSQKLEAVGQLAGGIAHDFNNALGGIMGAADLLRSCSFSAEEQREYLDMILTAGERAADLTKKLLTFSRKGAKASSAVDCFKIVNETAELLKHTIDKNIAVQVENRAIQTSVIGDDSLLHNALMNMGINASHAMPNGGELTFALENLELDEEYCAMSPFELKPGDYLEISIRDTGTGMSPEVQSRIFEPFFTTKELGKGTGLGMAAVYGTVQEHSGAIIVYSEVGTGTVFRIYLPITAETVRREITSELTVTGSGTVLVIDDEELIRITASALLRSLGYRVILATNGEEGVQTFLEAKEEIDLIILDMIMPVMGGREAFTKLREIDPTIPVIIASGFAKEEDMAELKKQGVSGFLNKPFRKAELAEMVGKCIQESK